MSESESGPGGDGTRWGNVRKNDELDRFELEAEGHTAIAYYRIENGVMVFTSTQTPQGPRNKGIATRLIQGAFEIAHMEGFTVAASCSFVADYLARHPELPDVKG